MRSLLLLAWAVAAASALQSKQWVEHFYGFVRGDGYQYFTFTVPPGVFKVEASVLLSLLQGRTPPVLFIKKDSFPSETNYDVRWNTSVNATYIRQSLPDLQAGTYFATMWGGNMLNSINTFGAGPSVNMWWYLDFIFSACLDADRLGGTCAVSKLPTSKSSQSGQVALKEGAYLNDCIDTIDTVRIYAFDLPQPAAGLSVSVSLQTHGDIVCALQIRMDVAGTIANWALYHDRANPLSDSAVPVRSGASDKVSTFTVDRPLLGSWLIHVKSKVSRGLCVDGLGSTISVSWATTACDDSDLLCRAEYKPMDMNRDKASGSGDSVLAATFTSDTPAFSTNSAPVGYVASIPTMYAGATFTVNLASNLTNGTVYIRANGFPSSTRFDYAFNIAAGSSFADPTLAAFNPQAPVPAAVATIATSTPELSFWSLGHISFPIVDAQWFMLVVPSSATGPFGAALYITSLACPQNYACSDRGSCLMKTTYQGLAYGECLCHYGYGGRQCESSVYSTSQRLQRSWLLLLSNAAIAPAVILSWRRKLYVEAVLFFGLGVISGLYHACDLQIFCLLPYTFLQAMDFAFTFNAIILSFIHLSGAYKQVKAGMQVFVLVSLIFMTTYNATSFRNWLAIGMVCALQFIGSWTYYITLASQRLQLSFPRTAKRFIIDSDNFAFRYLFLGFALFGGALGCFFTESGTEYWLLHSIWHLTAMSSAFTFMALRKNNRYRCVGTDGVDVLSSEFTASLRAKLAAVNQVNPYDVVHAPPSPTLKPLEVM
ncbi:hypothetical protein ACHHYP_01074 [Achlya hypogyna]|uniref:EGF-like domain-containing protein n=1 Tax=Achlya hypogyna TaxID=1202772 RepID=A0A1V9ZTV1_ACHHY|nr:hypothetical protein ACHHYP_01074 [Achlya hypogyna]